MVEPNFFVRVLQWAWAVICNEVSWITGFILVIEQVLETFAPKFKAALDEHSTKEQRRIAIVWLSAFAILVSAFQVSDGYQTLYDQEHDAKVIDEANLAAAKSSIQTLQTSLAVAQDSIKQYDNTDAGEQQQKIDALSKEVAAFEAQRVEENRERHISKSDASSLVRSLKAANPAFGNVQVMALTVPEATGYAREFMFVFHAAGMTVNGIKSDDPNTFEAPGPAIFYEPDMHGLFIGVSDGKPIPPDAIRFYQILKGTGLNPVFTAWDGIPPNGFSLIVGPK